MNPRVEQHGKQLRGAMTALVTPFTQSGEVDESALRSLVDWQIESGIHGLVPCGTTGEGATLTADECRRVIHTVVEASAGRVPVIAGCGTNDTRRTIEAARIAVDAGADALLVVTPYYNKPNRSGMRAHFRAVAESSGVPLVAYNVPGRTGQNIGAEGVLELAEIPGIAGVKEASGNLEQIATILAGRPKGFLVLSGDDALALPTLALGAEGLIAVISNEAPHEVALLVDRALAGDMPGARELHFRLLPLMKANFLESNPVPVKAALAVLGRCREDVRAPLGPPENSTRQALADALALARLLEPAR